MITERKEDLVQVESEAFIEKMLEKYFSSFVGDRDGNIYDQEGRQPAANSEEERDQLRLATGG